MSVSLGWTTLLDAALNGLMRFRIAANILYSQKTFQKPVNGTGASAIPFLHLRQMAVYRRVLR